MKRWIVGLGLAGLLVALAAYGWSRMNQDYDDDDLEDEIPIEFDVPLDGAVNAAAPDPPVALDTRDTGLGPGEDRQPPVSASEQDADDLTLIRGIGRVYQSKLQELGVRTFRQLADADPAYLEESVQGVGVDVPSWIAQAGDLAAQTPA